MNELPDLGIELVGLLDVEEVGEVGDLHIQPQLHRPRSITALETSKIELVALHVQDDTELLHLVDHHLAGHLGRDVDELDVEHLLLALPATHHLVCARPTHTLVKKGSSVRAFLLSHKLEENEALQGLDLHQLQVCRPQTQALHKLHQALVTGLRSTSHENLGRVHTNTPPPFQKRQSLNHRFVSLCPALAWTEAGA